MGIGDWLRQESKKVKAWQQSRRRIEKKPFEELAVGGVSDNESVDIPLPPKSVFWKALHAEDGVALKIMIAFLTATLILFVIIFYQQGIIYKQQKEMAKIPKLKQSVKFKNEAIAVKNKTIVSQAATITWLQNRLNIEKYYEELAKQAKKDWKEVQKNEDR